MGSLLSRLARGLLSGGSLSRGALGNQGGHAQVVVPPASGDVPIETEGGTGIDTEGGTPIHTEH